MLLLLLLLRLIPLLGSIFKDDFSMLKLHSFCLKKNYKLNCYLHTIILFVFIAGKEFMPVFSLMGFKGKNTASDSKI